MNEKIEPMIQNCILRTATFLFLAIVVVAIPTAADEKGILVKRGHEGWNYWDKAARPPEAWNKENFDDTAWQTGTAPLGYGVDGIATKISFGEDDKNKRPASYFRLHFNVDDLDAYPVCLGELRCDDGAAVYLNGEEIYRYNMPTGDLANATFSAATLTDNRKSNYHAFYLDVGLLKAGENVLAISVHQSDSGSSDLLMDFALTGNAEAGEPAIKPLLTDGVLESDDTISSYIDRWAKHLLKQDRAPNPTRLSSELSRILDREVDLIEPSDIPLSREEIYERCASGVLVINSVNESGSASQASGFVISADGLALTNYHVMRNGGAADIVVATTLSGRVVRVREILAANEADDIALIQLDGDGFHPLPIAKSPRVGSDLVTISHPRGAFFTMTKGQLSRHVRFKGRNRIMVTSEFAAGSSGAPILDRFGSVAGMVQETYSLAYRTVPLREEDGILKVKQGPLDHNLFLSMNHQMTLRYGVPCQSLRSLFKLQPLVGARSVEAPNPGLNWKLYEGAWDTLPDFAALEPIETGTCKSPAVDVHGGRTDNFGLVFTGFIDLPRDGAWQFRITSDDGSRLVIDDEKLVDNDGLHGAVSRSGSRRLAAGLHAIRIEFFDRAYEEALKLHYSGPGQPWTEIPASAFRRR